MQQMPQMQQALHLRMEKLFVAWMDRIPHPVMIIMITLLYTLSPYIAVLLSLLAIKPSVLRISFYYFPNNLLRTDESIFPRIQTWSAIIPEDKIHVFGDFLLIVLELGKECMYLSRIVFDSSCIDFFLFFLIDPDISIFTKDHLVSWECNNSFNEIPKCF